MFFDGTFFSFSIGRPPGRRCGRRGRATCGTGPRLLVVRFVPADLEGTVDLFERDHAREVVRQRDAAERYPFVRTGAHVRAHAVGSSSIYRRARTRTAVQVMSGLLPSHVARAVVSAAGLNPDEPIIAEQEAVVLAMVSESFGLKVKGIADPKKSQVTRGGYNVKDFNPLTMECALHSGLYVTGEALDVDGRCGGYNLHWAWTSGMLAGSAAAGAQRPSTSRASPVT